MTLRPFLSESPVSYIYHIVCQASKPTVPEFSVRINTADHTSFLEAPVPIRVHYYFPPQHWFLLFSPPPGSSSFPQPLHIHDLIQDPSFQDQIYISDSGLFLETPDL